MKVAFETKMDIDAQRGHRVIYVGACDDQIAWGGSDDPRGILTIGREYTVDHTEVHSWHTKVVLEGIEGKFPSVVFEDVSSATDAGTTGANKGAP